MENNETKKMRIGPAMRRVATYVASHPGCTMLDASQAAYPGPFHQPGYRAVHNAIKAGLVQVHRAMKARASCSLVVSTEPCDSPMVSE